MLLWMDDFNVFIKVYNPGPLVDLSYGVFHYHLTTFLFSKSFPP